VGSVWFWFEQPVSPLLLVKSGDPRKKDKTIVLDLDETLIHSTTRGARGYDLKVEVFIERQACLFYVYKRPFVDYFIRRVSEGGRGREAGKK
jgi:TFIIF-interacting CTD phosphatase-like protein